MVRQEYVQSKGVSSRELLETWESGTDNDDHQTVYGLGCQIDWIKRYLRGLERWLEGP